MYDHYIYNSYDDVRAKIQRYELQQGVISAISVYLAFFSTLALYTPTAAA